MDLYSNLSIFSRNLSIKKQANNANNKDIIRVNIHEIAIILINQINNKKSRSMPKSRNKNSKFSPKLNKQSRTAKSSTEKLKKKKDQINVIQTVKNLSLSFYNQQTLVGSKKIMLDLLPIQCVQTQYYTVPENLQLNNFGKWQKKSEGRHINPERKSAKNESKNFDLQKSSKATNNRNVKIKNVSRKTSTNSLPTHKKLRLSALGDFQKKQKDKNMISKQKIGNKNSGGRYTQLYSNGYLKKVLCSK